LLSEKVRQPHRSDPAQGGAADTGGPKDNGHNCDFPRLPRRPDSRPMKMLLDESTDTPPMSVIPENMRDHDPGRGWSASASIKMPTPKSGEVLIRVAAGGPLSGHHTAGGTLSAAAWDARDIGAWRFRRTVAGVGAHVIHPPGGR